MATISSFKSQLAGGGARSNQFRVELSFPSFVGIAGVTGLATQFLCKATTLPQSTITPATAFYRGRPVHFAGEREFAPWSISIYNDTNFAIRNALEAWQGKMLNYASTSGVVRASDYQVDLTVHQLDRNDAIVKTYQFHDAFPIEVGQISLDYETNNQIEIFEVTFQYNYFTTPTAPDSGNAPAVTGSVNTPIGSFPL